MNVRANFCSINFGSLLFLFCCCCCYCGVSSCSCVVARINPHYTLTQRYCVNSTRNCTLNLTTPPDGASAAYPRIHACIVYVSIWNRIGKSSLNNEKWHDGRRKMGGTIWGSRTHETFWISFWWICLWLLYANVCETINVRLLLHAKTPNITELTWKMDCNSVWL